MRLRPGLLPILLSIAVGSASAADWQPVPGHLMTRWAADVDPAAPHPEHPRPQMVRDSWRNLNGLWQFDMSKKEATQPQQFSKQILVPFPVESALSGIKARVEPGDRLWYKRSFEVPESWRSGRVLLHFTAVDWETEVFVNGKSVGRHKGGYDPFTFDISEALKSDGGQELVVVVWDPTNEGGQPIGKQTLRPGGIYYTPSSGIWGTVWIEAVPNTYIRRMTLMPDVDAGVVRLTVDAERGIVRAVVRDDDRIVNEAIGQPGQEIAIPIPRAKLWSPDSPVLYDLDLELIDGPNRDEVRSYFGMRKISIGPDERGITRILLNNRFVFQKGPLDQGFWPDGLHTAPTDAALRYDVEMTKAYGFNMSRKHVKIEPARWYYWCDKLGVLVWQDMPGAGNRTAEEKAQFEIELRRMVDSLFNHPSIVMWVLFNEGWGQYDTERLTDSLKHWDPSRLVNNASGWVDKNVGDILDHHTYPVPGRPQPSAARASVVGEYGGLGYNLKGHMWVDSGWGYQTFTDEESLNARYEEITGVLLERVEDPGISAGVYTQVSDIEVENNGLMTYDRAVFKIKPDVSARALKGLLPPRKVSLPDKFIESGVVELCAVGDKGHIVYTLDGSEPNAHSIRYSKPIEVRETLVVKARTVWPDGDMSRVVSFPMAKVSPRPAENKGSFASGLRVAVYETPERLRALPDFSRIQPATNKVVHRVDLNPKPRDAHFGLVFEGYLAAPETGVYLLRVASDDGAQVWIGGQPVCGKDGIHGVEDSVGSIVLEAGRHPIKVHYFQASGGQGLRLDWRAPGNTFAEIPASAFSHRTN